MMFERTPRERLVRHVQELERLSALKQRAAEDLADGFLTAKHDGFDPITLKVVLKLRTMTADQRRERRALEAIYMAALGMLEGDALPDAARRRLDRPPDEPTAPSPASGTPSHESDRGEPTPAPAPPQPPLPLKEPEEARREGGASAAAGKRIYDNPYPAGDPCRAAWDEGWCAQAQSHGMDAPAAYQRRTEKPPEKPGKDDRDQDDTRDQDDKKGAA